MGKPLHVLVVEDSIEDTALLIEELRRGGYDPAYTRVDTAEGLRAALERQSWDIAFGDYTMPHFNGLAGLKLVRERGHDLPFVFLSGTVSEETAVAAMAAGANDYILKGNLKRLLPIVARELRERNMRRELRQSEERFRQMAEHITEVIWMTTPDKNQVLYISPGYEKVWGRSCRSLYEAPGTWLDAIHPEDRERVKRSSMRDEVLGTYDEEYRIVRPDRSVRWVRDRAFPIKDASGQVYRITGIAEDITDRKEGEEALRRAEAFLNSIVENIPNMIFVKEARDLRFVRFNKAGEALLGYSREALLGKNDHDFFPKEQADFFTEKDRQVLKEGRLVDIPEEPIQIRNGEKRILHTQKIPLYDSDGKPLYLLGISEDITERRRTEEGFRNAKEFSENLIQTANVIILSLDPDGKIDIFNEAAEKITGYTLSELKGKNWFETLVPKERYPFVWEEFTRLVSGGMPKTFENPILTKSGEERYIMWQNNQVRIDGKVVATISFGNDITERKRAEEALKESEERLRIAIKAARMYTWDWDIQTDRIVRSGPCQEVYGPDRAVSDSSYASFLQTIHPEDRAKVEQAVQRALQGDALYHIEFRVVRSDGAVRWLEAQAQVYRSGSGKPVRMVGVSQDVTERKEAEELIQHMAFYDTLTELPNRNFLYDRLLDVIRTDEGRGNPFALLLMDLDHFKEINDTLGHHRGDILLQEVGRRLKGVLFRPDLVARLGGDEFAILLPRLAKVEDIDLVIEKIEKTLQPPFMIDGLPIAVEASVGVALYPNHGDNPDALLQRADVAMYAAKQSGNNWVRYDPRYDRHSPRRLALMGELRKAIEHDQLRLHFQPKIDFKSRQVIGVEALVRWQHPEYGFIPPDQFIAPAEKTGLIKPLTQWVLETALGQCWLWYQSGIQLKVSVNLSARNLQEPQLVERVADGLQSLGVAPGRLMLEITESAIMADPTLAMEVLTRLSRMGIGLSIDDFGTGYSSLSYLKRLPVNEIKIDKSFVIGMAANENDEVIVRSTIDLAHNLGLKVIAEGVEDESLWNKLSDLGCDVAQGYYMSRPLPAEDFTRWLGSSPWGIHPAPGP